MYRISGTIEREQASFEISFQTLAEAHEFLYLNENFSNISDEEQIRFDDFCVKKLGVRIKYSKFLDISKIEEVILVWTKGMPIQYQKEIPKEIHDDTAQSIKI